MNEDRYDSVEELIPKYLAGEASSEEEEIMLVWIRERPENELHYLGLKKIFELSKKHYEHERGQRLAINIDQEWNHFVHQISTKEKSVLTLTSDAPSRRWLRMAAALVLLVASGLIVNYFLSRTGEVRLQTAENTQAVTLPDGSKVVLNQHSELSYARQFGEKARILTLKGEAFFEVTHDASRPFTIKVNDAQVKVLGTSFNVQGYDKRKELEVIVQTGVVEFSVPGVNEGIKLIAGQKGIYSKERQQLSLVVNKDINFQSWNTRRIIFVENDLRAVVETLNKTYSCNIVLAADIPASCVVTVTFDHQTLEAVLRVLETTLNLSYRITGNRIEIIRAGC